MGEATLGKCLFLIALIVGIVYWATWYSAKQHSVENQLEQKIESGEYYKEEMQRQKEQIKSEADKNLTDMMRKYYKQDATTGR